jgi:predicted TIM-barrel fold metal-dependent hydrolase
MGVIDLHAHWFPPAFTQAFARLGGRRAWPEHPPELADRVAELAAAGVDLQVLGLGHNQPYFADADAASECAALANDLYAEAVAGGGGRLAAFAALPLPHVELALRELARCLDELGFAGVGIGTSVDGATLDDPSFEPLWNELDRRDATVFVHPVGTPDTFTVGLDGFMMGPKFGGPHEMTVAGARLLLSGVTSRYRRIRFVLATMGGSLLYLWPRFVEMSTSLGQLGGIAFEGDLRDAPRHFYYDTTLTDDPGPFRFVAEAVGVERLVLGTDAPRVAVADWIAAVRAMPGLAAADAERVLGLTARDALGLAPDLPPAHHAGRGPAAVKEPTS